jgi:hypothetical protein
MATCGSGGNCYVINDATTAFTGTVTISSVDFVTGKPTVVKSLSVNLAAGAGTVEYFSVPAPPPAPTPPPAGDCEFKYNLDWHPQTWIGNAAEAKGPSDCCDLCDKEPTCVVATYARGHCYMKAEKDQAGGSYAHEGVWSCKKSKELHVQQLQATGDSTNSLLTATVTSTDGTIVSTHPILFTEPKNLKLPKANVQFTLGGTGTAPTVSVTTDKVALYVTLTTLAQGRFSDNAFLLLAGETKKLDFIPFVGFDAAQLKSTLRVEHVASYM